jgi:autotransporter-associated beta strand protein
MQQWVVGVVAALALIAAGPAWAAPYTWTPTAAGTYNWDNSGPQNNWGSGFPNVIDDVANLNINLAGAETVNLNQAITVGTINLGDNASGYNAMTIAPNGGSLILDVSSGNATIAKATTGNNVKDVISANIQLNDNLTISNATTVGNVITLELSGIISESGANGITFTGVGKTFLSGTGNTFTGPVTVQNGTLFYNTLGNGGASSSLGAGSPTINLGSGANTVQLLHNSTSADTSSATINLTGSGATVTIGNDWSAQSGATVNGGATTFNGNFNNSTGATTLKINGDGSTGDVTINGKILDTGSGVTTVNPIGARTYTFNATDSTYTGKTILGVQAGNPIWRVTKLENAGQASSFGAPTGANATIDMSYSINGLQYIGTTDSTTDRAINLTGSANSSSSYTLRPSTANTTLKFTSDFTSTWVSDLNLNTFSKTLRFDGYNVASRAGKIWIEGKLVDRDTAGGKLLSIYLDDNNGTDFVTLTGTNTFTGTTTLFRNSYLTINTIKNVVVGGPGIPSSLGAPTNVVNGTIQFGQAGTSTLRYIGTGDTTDRVIDLKSNGSNGGKLEQAGTGLLTFTSAFTNSGSANALLTLQGSTAGIGEISGNLSDSSTRTLSLTKAGTGAWVLSGTNGYSGATAVNGGVLVFARTAAKSSSAVTAAAAGAVGLGVGGAGYYSSANVDALYANSLAGFTMNAGSGVGIDTTAGDFTYATSQTTDRFLHKTGANVLTLSGNNTNTKGATVWQGTLVLGHANALGTSGTITVQSNATFAVGSGVTFAPGARTMTFNAGAILAGQGTYNMANTWTTPAGLTLKPGLPETAPTGTLTVDVGGAGKTLAFGANNTLRIAIQPGDTYGKLMVNGALDVSNVRLVVTGTMPASKVVLAQGTSVTGPFQSMDLSGLTGGAKAVVTYTATQILLSPPPAGTVIYIR